MRYLKREKVVVLLGTSHWQLFRLQSRARLRQNPCQHSHASSQAARQDTHSSRRRPRWFHDGSSCNQRFLSSFVILVNMPRQPDNPQANTVRRERAAQQAQVFSDSEEVHTDVWGFSLTLCLGGR